MEASTHSTEGVSRRAALKGLLAFGCCCVACANAAEAARKHTIVDGDTLSAIAEKYGVTVKDLLAANRMKVGDTLSIGDKLVIPSKGSAAPAAAPKETAPAMALQSYRGGKVALAPVLHTALEKVRVKTGRWRYVVIHHSATASGDPVGMDAYHRKRRMENGLAYHFVIGNGRGMKDGSIAIGHRWKGQLNGGHLASEYLNAMSIGICLVGDFQKAAPTRAQIRSLAALTGYLLGRCSLPVRAVKLHREINTRPTLCPGKFFPKQSLMNLL